MDRREPHSPPRVLVGIVPTFAQAYPDLVPGLESLGCHVVQRLSATCVQPPELIHLLQGIDIFISGFSRVTEEVLHHASQLKLIVKYGAGFDDIDLRAATARNVIVTNAPGSNALSVAELTVGLMLALARNICQVDRQVKAGKFELVMGEELAGKCLGIVGLGKVGRLVARLASAFEMTVLAYDVVAPDPRIDELSISYVPLGELLRKSDFVSVHTPLLPKTINLIGERELRHMKPTAYLINTSRGNIVNEADLLKVLQERAIAGAALDVYGHEPPGLTPLIALDSVITTSHLGGATRQAARRIGEVTIRAVDAFLKGKRPDNVVNPEVFSQK